MRLLLTIFTILTILSSEGSSQNIDWGLGLIKIDDVSSEGFYNIPETGLEVLDENKKQIGSLIVKDNRIILKTSSEEKILDEFRKIRDEIEHDFLEFYNEKLKTE